MSPTDPQCRSVSARFASDGDLAGAPPTVWKSSGGGGSRGRLRRSLSAQSERKKTPGHHSGSLSLGQTAARGVVYMVVLSGWCARRGLAAARHALAYGPPG